MENMYNNKQCNGFIEDEICNKTSSKCIPSSIRNIEAVSETNDVKSLLRVCAPLEQQTTLDIEDTTASCTSSTDSGVHTNDNDAITPPSPPLKFSHTRMLYPSTTFSSETHTSIHPCNKNIQKNAKTSHQYECNNVTNNRNNNCKTSNNNNKHFIFNGDNNVGNDDEIYDISSENFDNTFTIVDGNMVEDNTRYQANQNIIESKNVSNVNQQQNSATSTINDKNARINIQRRPAPTSSSPSMSSISSSCCDSSPTKRNHCSGSPVVSIRSISSTIITSDSDSDLNSDTEGSHKNYVIKKLGTQVSYSANDPDIPKINSGHTVLNQRVIANSDHEPLAPLANLAAIGDGIGAAQALGSGPQISGVAQRPQIGSIALNNSTDVTFGDKHFYEGPVTIQQFLIDGRDKWKENDGKDNPTFVNEKLETSTNNAKDTNSYAEKPSKLYEHLLKRKKLAISAALAITALLIAATILGIKSVNDSKSKIVLGNSEESRNIIPINSTIDKNHSHVDDDHECDGNGTLCLVERDVWRAHPQNSNMDKQVLPLHRVVISHTASEPCETIRTCSERVRVIQEFHMNSLGWDDIGYNFLISSDGRVYVGRGWDFVGAHTKGYNYDSVGITFIGTYISVAPTEVQLEACLSLLEEGMRLKKLSPDYRLYGARQLGATESPGEMLYKRIRKWPHWSANINIT